MRQSRGEVEKWRRCLRLSSSYKRLCDTLKHILIARCFDRVEEEVLVEFVFLDYFVLYLDKEGLCPSGVADRRAVCVNIHS